MNSRLIHNVLRSMHITESIVQQFFKPMSPSLAFDFAPHIDMNNWQNDEYNQQGDNNDIMGSNSDSSSTSMNTGFGDLFGQSTWNMAVPKSRVSPGRKRQKWKQHIPDPIAWSRCDKCGEPKRPHRICTKNVEVCAMRPEEYKAYLGSNPGKEATPEP